MPSVEVTPEVQAAIEVLARHVVGREIVANADLSDYWEDLPLIGEHDWARVQVTAERIAAELDGSSFTEFEAAYQLLAARADQ